MSGVFDQATRSQRLYVNGRRVAEGAGLGDELRRDANAVLRIGMNAPEAPQRWDGLIDEFRIYTRAFTDSEVQALCDTASSLSVLLDIKPESFTNSINLSSAGRVPAAILGTPTFDPPGMVDVGTLRLAGAAVNLIGKTDNAQCASEDVNDDGRLDLVCHFLTAQFIIEPGDSMAVLEGKTIDGRTIRGQDTVRILEQ